MGEVAPLCHGFSHRQSQQILERHCRPLLERELIRGRDWVGSRHVLEEVLELPRPREDAEREGVISVQVSKLQFQRLSYNEQHRKDIGTSACKWYPRLYDCGAVVILRATHASDAHCANSAEGDFHSAYPLPGTPISPLDTSARPKSPNLRDHLEYERDEQDKDGHHCEWEFALMLEETREPFDSRQLFLVHAETTHARHRRRRGQSRPLAQGRPGSSAAWEIVSIFGEYLPRG